MKQDTSSPPVLSEETTLILLVPDARLLLSEEQELAMQAESDALVAKYGNGWVIESKADYEALAKDYRKCVKMRTSTDDWRKSVKRVIDEVSAKILKVFEPAEQLLAGLKKAYDEAEAERIRKEAEAKAKMIADRKAEIYALGGVFNGSAYVVGEVEIYEDDLPVDGFLLKIEMMRNERSRLDEVERLRKEEEARIEAERKAEAERLERARIEEQRKADEARRIAEEEKRKAEEENERLRRELEALKAAARVSEKVEAKVEKVTEKTAPVVEPLIFAEVKPVVEAVPPKPEPVTVHSPTITTPETKPASIIPTDESREAFLSGAKAALGMAKNRFTEITPDQWRQLWRDFQNS